MAKLTLLNLRTDLRDLINAPRNAEPGSNSTLNRLLNRAQRELAAEVRRNRELATFYQTSETITTTAATYTYALPADWVNTTRIEVEDGANLKYSSTRDFVDTADETAETAGYFGFQGNNLWLYPSPSTTGETYTHFYNSNPTDMSANTDNPDFPTGFERLIVLKAAVYYSIGKSPEASAYINNELKQKIMELRNHKRQLDSPHKVAVGRNYNHMNWPNKYGVT